MGVRYYSFHSRYKLFCSNKETKLKRAEYNTIDKLLGTSHCTNNNVIKTQKKKNKKKKINI